MGHRRQIDRINFSFLSCLDLRSLGTRLYTIISKTSLVGEWYDHYCEPQTTEYCGADGFTVIGMHLVCSWGCRPHSSNRSVFEGKSWCSPVSLCCDWLLLHGCSRQVVAYLNVGLFTCQQETVLHWTLCWWSMPSHGLGVGKPVYSSLLRWHIDWFFHSLLAFDLWWVLGLHKLTNSHLHKQGTKIHKFRNCELFYFVYFC